MRINNKEILRKITWRSLKSNRFRNIIAIIAMTLTAIMFTAIATIGFAVIQSFEEATFRQVGTSSHGGFKYLNEEQYEKISGSSLITDISYDIVVGFAVNPELLEKQHEVRYSSDKKAMWGFTYPQIGNMPKEYKDIVLSDITLDMLGLPHELGTEIDLEFKLNEEIISDKFTLCGIYEGDEIMWASQIFLSYEYVTDIAPIPENASAANFIGSINADVWFKNSINIEKKMNDVLIECGYNPSDFNIGVNWAYTSSGEVDFTSAFLIIIMVIIIMASGYLIIYSVFAISVAGDIQFYGLLKTIGTTGKQIKSIIRNQALILSSIGIPAGLILGFFLGTKLSTVLMGMIDFEISSDIKANPLIFIFSAIFSLITVFISCRKPGKTAAKVSPIEALRYTESGTDNKKEKKKSRAVTPFSMALANISSSRKRLITILLSLSLSLVLLNSVVGIVNGFDMDKYLKMQMLSDFSITSSSFNNFSILDRDNESITDEHIDIISKMNGITDYSRVFFRDYRYDIESDEKLERMEKIIKPYTENQNYKKMLDNALEEKYGILQIYGLDKLAFSKLDENFQKIDWEKFSSGKYALITTFISDNNTDNALYEIGEKIPLIDDSGNITEYEILGFIDYPHALGSQYSSLIDFTLVLPSDEFLSLFNVGGAMNLLLEADPKYISDLEERFDSLINNEMTELSYKSKSFYEDEFHSLQNTFLILGGVLSFILALIGILNFVNTTITSIITRKRELAMLQSIGMTNKQLKLMLFSEGLIYALLTLLLTLTVGSLVSTLLTKGIAGQMWFFSYNFSVTPVLLCAPTLLLICVIVPMRCAVVIQRESVVERLREN